MAIDPTNYINTWNNSSVLQQQFPDVNDYVALFESSSTPSTPLISSTPSTPGVESLMQPKIIDDFNDSGDQGNPPGGNTNAGYGYSGVDGFSLGDIGEGTVDKDDYTFGMQVNDAVRGAKTTLSGLPDRVKDYVKSGGLLGLGVKGVGKVFNYGRNVLSQGLQSLRNKQAEEKALADAMAEIESMRASNEAAGRGGYQSSWGNVGSFMSGEGTSGNSGGMGSADPGGSDSMGSFKDGGRIGFADGGSGKSSGIYGLLRRGIKNIEEGGLDSLFGERDNFSSEGGVGYSPLKEGDRNAIPKGSKFQPPIYYNPETGTDIGIAPYRVVIDPKQEQSKRYIGTQEQPKRPIKIKDVVPETGLGFEINKGKFTGGVQAPFTKSGLGSANYGIKYSNNPSSSISADYGKDDGLQFRYRKQFKNGGLATMFRLK